MLRASKLSRNTRGKLCNMLGNKISWCLANQRVADTTLVEGWLTYAGGEDRTEEDIQL